MKGRRMKRARTQLRTCLCFSFILQPHLLPFIFASEGYATL